MTQTILMRRSATPGKTPTTAQLSLGELSINTYDGKLFLMKNNGSASIVEVGAHPVVSAAVSADNSGLTYIQDLTFDTYGHVTGTVSTTIQSASTSQQGVVQLDTSTSSTSVTTAATPSAVKSAYDLASTALQKSGGTMTGFITLHADPSSAMNPATKQYVDNAISGLDVKQSVKVASTGNINVSAPGTAIDGITLTTGDRVLLKNQTSTTENGIYVFNGSAAALTRSTDLNVWSELPGSFVFVEQGTINADSGWVCTVDQGGTLGSTAVTWSQFSGAGTVTSGTGISVSGNQVSLATLTDSTTGSFLKITRDAYGRVSGTAAVTLSDLTGLGASTLALGSTTPSALGTASAGSATTAAKSDHIHPLPTMDSLSNISISSKASGDALLWNGTAWSNTQVYTKTYVDSMTVDGGSF